MQERKSRITILYNKMFEKLRLEKLNVLFQNEKQLTDFVTYSNIVDKIFVLKKEGI